MRKEAFCLLTIMMNSQKRSKDSILKTDQLHANFEAF